MGTKLKLVLAVVGLMALGIGAWPLGAACLLYLAVTLWPRSLGRISTRHFLAALMFILSAVAAASGGTFSPFVFAAAGAFLLAWSGAIRLLHFEDLAPVEGSILMKKGILPFSWTALAELKPGHEDFSRSVSGFGGRLLVFTDTGKVYSIASCSAPSRKAAESKILDAFRWSLPNGNAAYLLPLSSEQAGVVLRQRFTKTRFPTQHLAQHASRVSGVISLECDHETVWKASVFDIRGAASCARLPDEPGEVESPPLVWEVFESLAKRTRWPLPDTFSGFLSTMLATRGVPMGERIKEIATSGDEVKVQSLSGEEVTTTRAQLRALFSIYS